MAGLEDGLWGSAKASGAITSRRLVAAGATGFIVQASSSRDRFVGCSGQVGIADTKTGDFLRFGVQRVKVGVGGLSQGDAITSDSTGRAVKAGAGDNVAGYALEDAVVNDEAECMITPRARPLKKAIALPAFVANDSAPATIENGATYTVPQTAGNATVSLPTAAPDGTTCTIVANGDLNDHTVTVRDVTTPITAAGTANKRLRFECEKVGGLWYATLSIGP